MNFCSVSNYASSLGYPEHIPPREVPSLSTATAVARQSSWLVSQPRAIVDALLRRATVQTFRPNQVVVGINDDETGLHFLLQGTTDVWIPRATGELFPVHMITPYQWFGELSALAGRKGLVEYSGRTAGSTLTISRATIGSIRASYPELGQAVVDLLAHSIQKLIEISGDHAGFNVEKRVLSKLVTLSVPGQENIGAARHVVPISQSDLAVVCCVSRQTVNAVLRDLAARGIVEVGYRRIVVLRRADLIQVLRDEK